MELQLANPGGRALSAEGLPVIDPGMAAIVDMLSATLLPEISRLGYPESTDYELGSQKIESFLAACDNMGVIAENPVCQVVLQGLGESYLGKLRHEHPAPSNAAFDFATEIFRLSGDDEEAIQQRFLASGTADLHRMQELFAARKADREELKSHSGYKDASGREIPPRPYHNGLGDPLVVLAKFERSGTLAPASSMANISDMAFDLWTTSRFPLSEDYFEEVAACFAKELYQRSDAYAAASGLPEDDVKSRAADALRKLGNVWLTRKADLRDVAHGVGENWRKRGQKYYDLLGEEAPADVIPEAPSEAEVAAHESRNLYDLACSGNIRELFGRLFVPVMPEGEAMIADPEEPATQRFMLRADLPTGTDISRLKKELGQNAAWNLVQGRPGSQRLTWGAAQHAVAELLSADNAGLAVEKPFSVEADADNRTVITVAFPVTPEVVGQMVSSRYLLAAADELLAPTNPNLNQLANLEHAAFLYQAADTMPDPKLITNAMRTLNDTLFPPRSQHGQTAAEIRARDPEYQARVKQIYQGLAKMWAVAAAQSALEAASEQQQLEPGSD
jgi:hypothetical protein